jgi:hypothetical protein
MAMFRDPVYVTFIDADNRELKTIADPILLPRVGENLRLAGVPYVVERIGYDLPKDEIARVWVVLQPA